jgi:hypothetical protein
MKIYQLADPLKWICREILGLTNEQCNGTDEQKNSKTSLMWEFMPGIDELVVHEDAEKDDPIASIQPRRAGPMTGREVMQYVGTDIFRRMSPNVWIDATIRRIQKEGPTLAIVSDVRFPNEVAGIQTAGGKVIRFTRDPFKGEDKHVSETALDELGDSIYDAVIENEDVGIPRHNELVYKQLMEWGYLDHIETDALDRMGAPQ